MSRSVRPEPNLGSAGLWRRAALGMFGLLALACGSGERFTDAEPDEPRAPRAPDAPRAPGEPAPELGPRERDQRGDEHLLAGRFAEAIEDFDAFLAAEPEFDPHHWRRGIAYYYAERYEEGAAQFVRHRRVNPNDVENAAWHFLCLARAMSVDEARAALLPVGPDQRDPMREVYALFAGRAQPRDVLAAAEASAQPDAVFFAHLYLGLYHEALGERDAARRHIELSATTHARSHYMGRVARMHAERMGD